MKAIVIGHTEKSQGAYSDYFQMHEWKFFNSFIGKLKEVGDVYFHNPKISSYRQRMKSTANELNKKNYDMVLCLHFNAFNGRASGTEVLCVSEKGAIIGTNFNAYMAKLGLKNRGVKKLNSNSRGYSEIFHPQAPAVILEPFFGDNPNDCKLFNIDKFIEALKCL